MHVSAVTAAVFSWEQMATCYAKTHATADPLFIAKISCSIEPTTCPEFHPAFALITAASGSS